MLYADTEQILRENTEQPSYAWQVGTLPDNWKTEELSRNLKRVKIYPRVKNEGLFKSTAAAQLTQAPETTHVTNSLNPC